MFIFRFGFLALVAIMLLPTGPGDSIGAGFDGSFCTRYPRTCDASVEIAAAFQKKLSYGVTLARQSLQGRSDADGSFGPGPTRAPKYGERFGEWRPSDAGGRDGGYAGGNLAPDERRAEWRRN